MGWGSDGNHKSQVTVMPAWSARAPMESQRGWSSAVYTRCGDGSPEDAVDTTIRCPFPHSLNPISKELAMTLRITVSAGPSMVTPSTAVTMG